MNYHLLVKSAPRIAQNKRDHLLELNELACLLAPGDVVPADGLPHQLVHDMIGHFCSIKIPKQIEIRV